ncbi:MAG: beta-lactamase family protein [Ilumatobacter sp.]|nr:beta-lactamase family protein [Ilumatobacter sp.]
MQGLIADLRRLADEHRFSGVVRVDVDDHLVVHEAFGFAHRALAVANTVGTQFGIASGTKGLTALAVMALVERGDLRLDTTARSLLGDDLPLVEDRVTVEQLLAHRSGIGDYLDEEVETDVTQYLMPVPVHELDSAESYLRVLDKFPSKFEPGQRFSYCNGGYVILALLAERASGISYHDLVRTHVTEPAGMTATAFLRSDELPGTAAVGYLDSEGPRTNVFHLPVVGVGDGGVYSTADDLASLWRALFDGRIVATDTVAATVAPRSDAPDEDARYGLGFWLHRSGDAVMLVGGDAGVSFRSVHGPSRRLTHTVISNTSDGAWPLTRHLDAAFGL